MWFWCKIGTKIEEQVENEQLKTEFARRTRPHLSQTCFGLDKTVRRLRGGWASHNERAADEEENEREKCRTVVTFVGSSVNLNGFSVDSSLITTLRCHRGNISRGSLKGRQRLSLLDKSVFYTAPMWPWGTWSVRHPWKCCFRPHFGFGIEK